MTLRKNNLWGIASAALAVCLMLATPAVAADETATTTVSVSRDLYYNIDASGTANLSVGATNYNTIGEYNFINVSSPSGTSIVVNSNVPWFIKARLSSNMPASPGGGYSLRVDDDRTGGVSSGWSNALSTANVDLPFDGIGATATNRSYFLDWRIEGLTEEDGIAPLSRDVIFTIYSDGNF